MHAYLGINQLLLHVSYRCDQTSQHVWCCCCCKQGACCLWGGHNVWDFSLFDPAVRLCYLQQPSLFAPPWLLMNHHAHSAVVNQHSSYLYLVGHQPIVVHACQPVAAKQADLTDQTRLQSHACPPLLLRVILRWSSFGNKHTIQETDRQLLHSAVSGYDSALPAIDAASTLNIEVGTEGTPAVVAGRLM
jgi:hypothetical protein